MRKTATTLIRKPLLLALTAAALAATGAGSSAFAGEHSAPHIQSSYSAQGFDQSRIDRVLHPHQGVGLTYRVSGKTYSPAHNPAYNQVGNLSWYGDKFHGKPTASGERFNKHAMTAAHKTLPLNSLVVVTDMNTGKSVTVRINDRGPFVGNGIIDLSEAAAFKLGNLSKPSIIRVQYAGPAIPVRAKSSAVKRRSAPAIIPQVQLPKAPVAAPEASLETGQNDQTTTLTIKGPIHMA